MRNKQAAGRRGRTRLVVLIAVLVAVAVPVGWIWSRPATQPNPDVGRKVAEEFLREIREGQPESAWESATADFKSDRGKASFVRDLGAAPYLKEPLDFVSVQTVAVNDSPRSEILFRSTKGAQVRIVLNREGGNWKVDRWSRDN